MIEYRKFITRQMLRSETNKLFVFGDNLQRKGLGGQAKEMRGEPNAVGIPTKWAPSMDEDAFLVDTDLGIWEYCSQYDRARLLAHHANGGIIVWPEDGIGTGLAQLPQRSPLIWEIIEILRKDLEKMID